MNGEECREKRQPLRSQVLIRSAVEKLRRYVSPLETATERYAREDVTIEGVTTPGGLMYAALASANRDERQFLFGDVQTGGETRHRRGKRSSVVEHSRLPARDGLARAPCFEGLRHRPHRRPRQ